LIVIVHLHANLRWETPTGLVSRLEMDLAPGSDVRALLGELGLSDGQEALLIAVNGRMGKLDQVLSGEDVVRVMPPISGGSCAG
jgi:sulfur carrier protein ThiS